LLLATLEWRHAPWLWPPLMALWANLHGGFVFGLGVLGLHAIAETERSLSGRSSRERPLPAWLGLGAAALAACANPWGPRIYLVPLQTLDPGTFRDLIEWYPTGLSLDPRIYAGRFGWMLVAAAAGLSSRRRDPFAVVLAVVTALMAFRARRFVPLFAIAAAPLAAAGAGMALHALRRRFSGWGAPHLHAITGGVALLVALALWRDVRLTPHLLQRWTSSDRLPSGAAAYLEAMAAPPRHLFALYDWGGYLMVHAPSVPIFIDGRAGTVYPDEVARDYLVLAGAHRGWRRLLRGYAIDAVLVDPGSPLARALTSADPPWQIAHADVRSTLLVPPGDPVVEELGLEGADLHLRRSFLAHQQGRLADAMRELSLAQQQEPSRLDPYRGLMLVAAKQGRTAEVQRWIDAALDLDPRHRDQVWLFAADAWRELGDATAELDALRRIRLAGPFDDETARRWVRDRIGNLEERTSNARWRRKRSAGARRD
jgi:hypothetical protein